MTTKQPSFGFVFSFGPLIDRLLPVYTISSWSPLRSWTRISTPSVQLGCSEHKRSQPQTHIVVSHQAVPSRVLSSRVACAIACLSPAAERPAPTDTAVTNLCPSRPLRSSARHDCPEWSGRG